MSSWIQPSTVFRAQLASAGAAIFFSVLSVCADIRPVPTTAQGNRFEQTENACFRASEDGARALLDKRLALNGAEGALLCPTKDVPPGSTTTPSVRVAGAWRINAGDEPTTLLLGTVPLILEQSEIIAITEGDAALLLIRDGTVRLRGSKSDEGRVLRNRVPYRCTETSCTVSPEKRPFLLRTLRRLKAASPEPLLVLDDPSTRRDRKLPDTRSADAEAEIEIEAVEIEIEPGCIEVCQD